MSPAANPTARAAPGGASGGDIWRKKKARAAALLSLAALAGPAASAPVAEAWRAATVSGCLAALERAEPIDGAALGLDPAPGLALPYAAPARVWRDPEGRFALGTAALPDGATGRDRRICEAESLRPLGAHRVNAVYSDFLDWAGAAVAAGRYVFLGTRRNDDSLTGLASLASDFVTARGYALEVTFVAQPVEGRVAFSAQELRREVAR